MTSPDRHVAYKKARGNSDWRWPGFTWMDKFKIESRHKARKGDVCSRLRNTQRMWFTLHRLGRQWKQASKNQMKCMLMRTWVEEGLHNNAGVDVNWGSHCLATREAHRVWCLIHQPDWPRITYEASFQECMWGIYLDSLRWGRPTWLWAGPSHWLGPSLDRKEEGS